jgi:hypothetical protein
MIELVNFAPTSPLGTLLLAGVFISLFVLQLWHPLRTIFTPTLRHLFTNLTVAAAAAVPVRLLVIPVGLAVSTWARQHRFGI